MSRVHDVRQTLCLRVLIVEPMFVFRGSEAKVFRRSLIGGFFNPGPLFFDTDVCGLLLERMKLEISNWVCRLNVKITGITHAKVLHLSFAFKVT